MRRSGVPAEESTSAQVASGSQRFPLVPLRFRSGFVDSFPSFERVVAHPSFSLSSPFLGYVRVAGDTEGTGWRGSANRLHYAEFTLPILTAFRF